MQIIMKKSTRRELHTAVIHLREALEAETTKRQTAESVAESQEGTIERLKLALTRATAKEEGMILAIGIISRRQDMPPTGDAFEKSGDACPV